MTKLSSDNFAWSIQNNEKFQADLKRLGERATDFRIPFRLIASDFYRSQKQIFSLQSAGLYQDLSTKPFLAFWQNKNGFASYYAGGYKEYKQINLGFTYPILVGKTRDLSESTLTRNHRYSIFMLSKQNLTIGTSVPYGKYHQSDKPRKKIPQRKFIFIDGGPEDKSRGSGITGRSQRWTMIIDAHLKQLITGEL